MYRLLIYSRTRTPRYGAVASPISVGARDAPMCSGVGAPIQSKASHPMLQQRDKVPRMYGRPWSLARSFVRYPSGTSSLTPYVVNMRFLAGVLFPLVLGACGPSTAPEPAAPRAPSESTEPVVDVQAQFEREAEPIPKQSVRHGAWRASLESKTSPQIIEHEQAIEIVADLGWDSSLHCFVCQNAINPATMIHAMLEAAAANVDFQSITPYGFDRDGLVPVVGFRGLYQVEQGSSLLSGDYKLMVMPRPEYPVWCFHDAAGYARSFLRVTSEFARSFEFDSSRRRPDSGELWTLTLDETTVGFSQHATFKQKNGAVRRESVSVSFIPTNSDQLLLEDHVSDVTSDAGGALVKGTFVTYENGVPGMAIDVLRTKRGYEYSGTLRGEAVSGTFKTPKPVVTAYALEKRLKSLNKKARKSTFDQWEYSPSIDVTQASKVAYTVTPDSDGLLVSVNVAQRSVTMRAKPDGSVYALQTPVGAFTVESALVDSTP